MAGDANSGNIMPSSATGNILPHLAFHYKFHSYGKSRVGGVSPNFLLDYRIIEEMNHA